MTKAIVDLTPEHDLKLDRKGCCTIEKQFVDSSSILGLDIYKEDTSICKAKSVEN